MNLTRSKTCLFSLFISFFILSSYTTHDQTSTSGCSSFYAWILLLAGALLVAALAIVALRATVVTWITLVLLTVAGKGRRVLVSEGKKITTTPLMLQCTWSRLCSKKEAFWLLQLVQLF